MNSTGHKVWVVTERRKEEDLFPSQRWDDTRTFSHRWVKSSCDTITAPLLSSGSETRWTGANLCISTCLHTAEGRSEQRVQHGCLMRAEYKRRVEDGQTDQSGFTLNMSNTITASGTKELVRADRPKNTTTPMSVD